VGNANVPLSMPGPIWTSGNNAVHDPFLDVGERRSESWLLIGY
jgi:hypothetical protein